MKEFWIVIIICIVIIGSILVGVWYVVQKEGGVVLILDGKSFVEIEIIKMNPISSHQMQYQTKDGIWHDHEGLWEYRNIKPKVSSDG